MSYDMVVVGGGVFGVSTAIYLAIHYPKIKFALVEQYKVGHGEGSSHSDIRIIRSTYEDAFYRDLCIQGILEHWPEV
jgi:glycine/D-amino acid oxidase-like deaminating enzyme